MNLRRVCSLLLVLCLLLALAPAALAAPTRDTQRAEITLEPGMKTLVELVLGAAVLQDVPCLEEGQAPSPALVEGVLALGLYTLALPYAGEDIWENKASLTDEEIAGLYRMVFTTGEYARPDALVSPGISLRENGLAFDLSSLSENPVIGAHIYSTVFDGSVVTLDCDLFTSYVETAQSAEDLPEDALTWLCNARVLLTYAPETPYGYTLNGFSLSETYLNGMLYDWKAVENTEFEYSVTLPSILGLAEDAPACMVWQTADGEATLTIEVTDAAERGYDAALESFLKDADGLEVTQMREFSCFSAVGEGVYELHLAPEEINWAYTLVFHFPAQRQAEFTLYAEFIRNSLILWGVSNG